jgi:hypothetical protein
MASVAGAPFLDPSTFGISAAALRPSLVALLPQNASTFSAVDLLH